MDLTTPAADFDQSTTPELTPPAKPKRAATSGTRKGNGSGASWGGAAKGAGNGSARAPAFGVGNKAAAKRKPD